jgi:hypothetical protein
LKVEMFGRKRRSHAFARDDSFFWGEEVARVTSDEWRRKEGIREFLAAWADIIAGAMMKEKTSAHSLGMTAPVGRVEKCGLDSGTVRISFD